MDPRAKDRFWETRRMSSRSPTAVNGTNVTGAEGLLTTPSPPKASADTSTLHRSENRLQAEDTADHAPAMSHEGRRQ